MDMTPSRLRAREDELFNALECAPNDPTFRDRLSRDGVPTPEVYLAQRVRVLFVFREPNLSGNPRAHDMRVEVSDPFFRPRRSDGSREKRSQKGWWNWKAGMFAHAVDAAFRGEPWPEAFSRFRAGGWNHDVVNRFAYIQVKKVGGAGESKPEEIRLHAMKYASILRQQVELYRPHLLLGCGTGATSPAQLFAKYVLPGGRTSMTTVTGATWWRFPLTARPMAMLQLWHPAHRGSKTELYQDVCDSVREVAQHLRLVAS